MNASHLLTRASVDVADGIRNVIASGQIQLGRYLPSERSLAAEYGVSGKTVRKALKVLEMEGRILVEPRKGYKVLSLGDARPESPTSTLAFVYSGPATVSDEVFYRRLLSELQLAAGRRGMGLLGICRDGRDMSEVIAHIRGASAGGVILNDPTPGLLDPLDAMALPVVMVDASSPDARFDAVMTDGFGGGAMGANWLADRGHEAIVFFGHCTDITRSQMERLGGALATLTARGLDIPPDWRINVPFSSFDTLVSAARSLLTRPNRPRAILAPWQGPCHALLAAARESGLVIGCDLDMVGWSIEEDYPDFPPSRLAPNEVPPMIVWSAARLAEAAISRLIERRSNPGLSTTTIKVPVSLRQPGSQKG